MAYCIIDDVKSLFLSLPTSGTTQITDTEITAWINEESAYIDSLLRSKYRTPLLDVDSLLVVKKACAYLVAAEISFIIQKSTGKVLKFDDSTFDMIAMKQGKDILNDIKSQRIILGSSDLLIPSEKTYMTTNVKDNVIWQDEGMEPVFRKNVTQW